MRLIARHGFAAVSMRRIARDVGVQAGALYNYFPDKQSLLARLMLGHMTALLEASETLATRGAPEDRLHEFVRFHIGQNYVRAEAVFVAYMELRSLTPENFASVEALRRRYEDKLVAILDAGVGARAFEVAKPQITARAIIAMLNGVNTWFSDAGPLALDEVQDLYWEMVRKLVS